MKSNPHANVTDKTEIEDSYSFLNLFPNIEPSTWDAYLFFCQSLQLKCKDFDI